MEREEHAIGHAQGQVLAPGRHHEDHRETEVRREKSLALGNHVCVLAEERDQ